MIGNTKKVNRRKSGHLFYQTFLWEESIVELINYIHLSTYDNDMESLNFLFACHELLSNSGKLGIISWVNDDTPYGPPLEKRPLPEDIIEWGPQTNLRFLQYIELSPYHFGVVFGKK